MAPADKKNKRKKVEEEVEVPAEPVEASPKKKAKKKGKEPGEKIAPVPAPVEAPAAQKGKKQPPKKAEEKQKPPPPVNEESSDESDVEKEANGDALPEWSEEEYVELFTRMQQNVPKDDNLKYDSRLNHIDWAAISFNGHSAEECKERWGFVQNHIRRFRLLSELLTDAREWAKHPWTTYKKTGKAGQRHPDQPKRPLSSFMLYFMEVRDKIASENPDLDLPKLSKHIGALYQALPEKKKQKYVEMANKAKEEYKVKWEKFVQDHPGLKPEKKPEKSPPVGKIKPPTPPGTPFKMFYQEKQKELMADENVNKVEALEKCRGLWKTLPEEEKLEWIEKYVELEAAYRDEVEKFKAANPSIEVPPFKSALSKDELALKAKSAGKPEKPPNSGYSLFSKELLGSEALRHLESKDRMAEISRLWKDLPEQERAEYNERARELISEYKLEFASYLDTLSSEEREAELKSALPKGSQKNAAQREEKEKEKEKKEEAKKEKEEAEPAKKKKKTEKPEKEKAEANKEKKKEADKAASKAEDDKAAEKQIAKPNSALEMFCQKNMEKYRAKQPEATDQELLRAMAKAYSKLKKAQKEQYQQMADSSKSQQDAPATSTTPKQPSKAAAAAATTPKQASKAAAMPKQTPKAAATVNPSPSKAKKETSKLASPVKAANGEGLYKNEPEKPPSSVEELYANVMSKSRKMEKSKALEKWNELSSSQKEKYTRQFNSAKEGYIKALEAFLRGLSPSEMKEYKAVLEKRRKAQDSDSGESEEEDDEEEEEEEVNNKKDDDEDDEEEEEEDEEDEESSDSD